MKKLNDIIKYNLCLGCGLCTINPYIQEKPLTLKYSLKKGHDIPNLFNSNNENQKVGFDICPGKGYRINTLAKKFGLSGNFHQDLGYYHSIKVVKNENPIFLKNASSSGISTLIIYYLITNKIVDKAIVTKFDYTKNGPIARPFITNKLDDLIEAQGSKYCPVNLSEVINEIKLENEKLKYVFVGTPCQIAGLRNIQANIQDLGIKFFIGNFCGGIKSYNNLKQLINLNKINPQDVTYFRFRGGGQPGSLKISTKNINIEIPYPEYVKMTGYPKLKRCHLCVDATAELADFSCGDAWLKEYLDTKEPTSIVITRNKEATKILNKMDSEGLIITNNINEEKVIKSQIGNIKSKKHRQYSRLKFYKLLNIKTPDIIEGFKKEKTSIMTEMNVFLSHKVKLMFEKLGLFYFFYYKNHLSRKIILKIFKDIYN